MTNLPYANDRLLVTGLREGSADAFTAIYREYHDVLYLYAFRILEDEDLAEDSVHDVFLSLWERRGKVQPDIALRPYLFQAVRFKCINLLQHHRVREKVARHFRQYLTASTDQVAEHVEEREFFGRLRAVVDRLPGKMSQVFWMRHDNIPDEEIAERLGISVKTVKNLMSQTVKKLKARFQFIVVYFFA